MKYNAKKHRYCCEIKLFEEASVEYEYFPTMDAACEWALKRKRQLKKEGVDTSDNVCRWQVYPFALAEGGARP